MDVDTFSQKEEIDAVATVRFADLADADRSDALLLVPGVQSVVVFGKEIPLPVYALPPKEKTREMFRIAGVLDRAAARLAEHLNEKKLRSAAAPFILPVHMEKDRVHGAVRLKRIAASGGLGTIGESSLLISPRFGTRLVLGAVVTEMAAENPAAPLTVDLCKKCGHCTRACPGGAIGYYDVDSFRCRNISAKIPASRIPAVKWMLRRKGLQRLVAPFSFRIARQVTVGCSLCVTVCPCFRSGVPEESL